MKIAVLSESTADEAAVCVLTKGLLGGTIERVPFSQPPTRGWRGVFRAMEPVLRHLHYRTDADALVVTLDSDESPVHRREHDVTGANDPKCRLCQLRAIVGNIKSSLRPRQGRAPLGLAVPAIEAWCLYGSDPHITESAWLQALQSHRLPYTKKELKRRLYGCTEPILDFETSRLVEEARRLVVENRLTALEKCFPVGFGSLANEVRGWLL